MGVVFLCVDSEDLCVLCGKSVRDLLNAEGAEIRRVNAE